MQNSDVMIVKVTDLLMAEGRATFELAEEGDKEAEAEKNHYALEMALYENNLGDAIINDTSITVRGVEYLIGESLASWMDEYIKRKANMPPISVWLFQEQDGSNTIEIYSLDH